MRLHGTAAAPSAGRPAAVLRPPAPSIAWSPPRQLQEEAEEEEEEEEQGEPACVSPVR